MADANINAILAAAPTPGTSNPLQLLSGYQDMAAKAQALQNAQAQNALIGASTANTEQATTNAQLANAKTTAEMAQAHRANIGSQIVPLLNKPQGTLTQDDATGLVAQLAKGGSISQSEADQETAAIGNTSNEGQLRDYLTQRALSTLAPATQADRLLPSQYANDTGNGIQLGTRNGPNSGVAPSQPNVTTTAPSGQLSAAAGSQPTDGGYVQLPNGQWVKTISTVGRLNTQLGATPAPVAPPGANPASAIPGNGGYHPTPAPGATTPGSTSPQTGGMVLASPPLGTGEGIAANLDGYYKDLGGVQQHQTNVQNLQKAHDALEIVDTGAGSDGLAKMRAYATTLATTLGIDPGSIGIQDMARADLEKYLTDYARQTASSGGTNLDQQLSTQSNASAHINASAARGVINTNIGKERVAAYAPQAGQPTTYLADKAALSNVDPRAFSFDMMTATERSAMLTKMSDSEKTNFYRSLGIAQKSGMLNLGRQNMFKGGVTTDPSPSTGPTPNNDPVTPSASNNMLTPGM